MAGDHTRLKELELEMKGKTVLELRFLWQELTGKPASIVWAQKFLMNQIVTYYQTHPELLAAKKRARGLDLPPGTVLYRFYRRRIHKVTVRVDGFEYEGKVYKHISAIARIITGQIRSGVEFFGENSGRCWKEIVV